MTRFQITVLALLAIGVLGVFVIGGVMIAMTLQAPSAPTPPTAASIPTLTQVISGQNWEYHVTGIERTKTLNLSPLMANNDAQGTYLIIYLTLKNVSKQNLSVRASDFKVRDKNDVNYDAIDERLLATFLYIRKLTMFSNPPIPGTSVNTFVPGVQVSTALIFDISPDAKQLQLRLGQTATLVVSDVGTVPTVIPPTAWPFPPPPPSIGVTVVTPTAQTRSRPTATTCTAALQRISIPNGKPLHVDETLSSCSKSFVVSMANGQVIQFAYFGYNDNHWTDFKVRDPTGKIIQGEGAARSLYFAATMKGDYTLTFQGPGRLIFDIIVENMPSN